MNWLVVARFSPPAVWKISKLPGDGGFPPKIKGVFEFALSRNDVMQSLYKTQPVISFLQPYRSF